jgi:hypothetical protein
MRRIVLALEGSSGEGGQSSVVRGPLTGMARARECVPRRRRRARPRRDQRRRGVNTTRSVAAVPNAAHGLTCYLSRDNMLSRTRDRFQSGAEWGRDAREKGRAALPCVQDKCRSNGQQRGAYVPRRQVRAGETAPGRHHNENGQQQTSQTGEGRRQGGVTRPPPRTVHFACPVFLMSRSSMRRRGLTIATPHLPSGK